MAKILCTLYFFVWSYHTPEVKRRCARSLIEVPIHLPATGLFASPHLNTLTERVRINGQNCPDDLFLKCFWRPVLCACYTRRFVLVTLLRSLLHAGVINRYWDQMHKTPPSDKEEPILPSFFQSMILVCVVLPVHSARPGVKPGCVFRRMHAGCVRHFPASGS